MRRTLLALSLALLLPDSVLAGGILTPKPLAIAPTGYQYGPSIMYDDGVYKMWWCGASPLPGDGIFYATSPDGANWSPPQLVFTRAPGPWGLENGNQAWDGAHVCDPSVVKGGTPGWAYTMYYTGVNSCCTRWRARLRGRSEGLRAEDRWADASQGPEQAHE